MDHNNNQNYSWTKWEKAKATDVFSSLLHFFLKMKDHNNQNYSWTKWELEKATEDLFSFPFFTFFYVSAVAHHRSLFASSHYIGVPGGCLWRGRGVNEGRQDWTLSGT